MSKMEDAKKFLQQIGMPIQQQSNLCCLALLTLAHIKEYDSWKSATNEWIRIHDVIEFAKTVYQKKYAENTRETIRKQAFHPFRDAALIEDNGKATNSPNYRYRLTKEACELLKKMDSSDWSRSLQQYQSVHESLIQIYASKKKMQKMPVQINGKAFEFSLGKHNQLQKLILEEFAPRFAPNSLCLYVGDTIKKDLLKAKTTLAELGFSITLHDKMPDVVLYRKDKNWLFFIEAVTSVGPISPERINELEKMTNSVKAGKIYITAFLDFRTYKKFASQLAWETEVWIAEMPDHMIHLNGDKFLGPR